MRKTIKFTCWIAASLLILCAIIFHHSFLTYVAKGALQAYSVAVWGNPLQYESLSLKDYKIVIERPWIENETFFSAERLTLDFNLRLRKQLVKIGVDLDQPHWHFPDASDSSLKKWTKLLNQEGSWIKANPHLHFKKGTLSWVLDGSVHQLNFDLKANSKEGGVLRLFFDSPEINHSSLIVQTCKGNKGIELDCRCQNLNCASFAALAQFFGLDSNPWQVTSGVLQGSVRVVFSDITSAGEVELDVKEFEAFHLSSKFKPWNLSCSFSKIKAHGRVNFGKQDFWSSLDGEVYLEDGKGSFDDLHPALQIQDIQAHIIVKDGRVVDHSLGTLQVAGLKGKVGIEWGGHKQLLTFKLDGKVRDLSNFFPLEIQQALDAHFAHNHLMVLANIRRKNQQMEIGGTLHIQREREKEARDVVHFGWELKKSSQGKELKSIPVGWFHAQNLPLEKYLSPFIFRNKTLEISGEGEFKGSFDDQFLSIEYDGRNIKLENEKLCLTIPSLHSSVPGKLTGSHHLDLLTHSYEGTLPIHSASYLEKNTGLLFHDIQGTVHLTNGMVHIKPIEAFCEGIYFGGDLKLDYRDPVPGAFDVAISCPSISGRVSQIQHLLAHFNQQSLLYQIPLEGEVFGKEKGLQLQFNFSPNDYQLQSSMKGILNEGFISFEGSDISLKGIDLDINYDHQRQLLEFKDIQGALFIGKPRRVEEYLLTGDHIHVYSLSQPNIDIDLAIKDKNYELLRVVGHTRDEEEGIKGFHLDPGLSHFSCIYPTGWKCRLGQEAEVERLEFHSSFDLSDLLRDLKRFRQTGLFFISHSLMDKILQFQPIEGGGALDVDYQLNRGLSFQLEGSQIKYGGGEEHHGLLKGNKKDRKWIVDQIQWDEWSAYAELQQMDHQWRIPFLGLKIGDALLLGMDGDLDSEEASLKGRLKYCQVDLSKLDAFNSLKSFVAKWWPRGTLSATGEVEWNLLSSNRFEGFRAHLVTDISNFSLRNYPLQLSHPFQVDASSSDSICLKDVQLEVNGKTHLAFNTLEYGVKKESIQSLEGVFQIPHDQLEAVAETFHHHFPELFDESVKEIIASSKKKDQLQGTLSFQEGDSTDESLKLTLEDGLYTFRNRPYELKHFQLQIKKEKLQFSALVTEERLHFQVVGEVAWPCCHQGKFQLMSLDGSKPLLIDWENRLKGQGAIESIQGEFCGCTFALKRGGGTEETNEWAALEGKIEIDFNRLSPLLSLSTAEAIQKLKIGSFYTIDGNFWINPERGTAFYEAISFKGKFQSQEAILKGHKMKSFRSDLQYVPGRFDLLNFAIEDPAGSVKAPNGVIALDDDKGHWVFSFPRLTVKNFRPNILRENEISGQVNPKLKSLLFKKIDFQEMKGNVDDIATWQAQGSLQFLNASRKNALQALFAIPAEVILRLGLDPQVLNPVTGTVLFNLQGDRFYLKRFKDVFSEGRGSKFYLIGPDPSWIDFNGDLSMNIWMKQYNLIFKITELFTVSIQGNIKKPRYSLQKQSNVSKKGSKKTLIPKSLSRQIENKKKNLVRKTLSLD